MKRDLYATPSDPDNLINSNHGKFLIQSTDNIFSSVNNNLGTSINPNVSYQLTQLTYGFEIEFPKEFEGYIKVVVVTRKIYNDTYAMSIMKPELFGDMVPEYEFHGYTGPNNIIGGPKPNWYQNTKMSSSGSSNQLIIGHNQNNSILVCTFKNNATTNAIPNRLFVYGDQNYTYDVQTCVEVTNYKTLKSTTYNQYYRGNSTSVTYTAENI